MVPFRGIPHSLCYPVSIFILTCFMTSTFIAKCSKSFLRKRLLAQFYCTFTNAPCSQDMPSAAAACAVGKVPKQWHFDGPMALLPVPFFQSTSVKTPWTLGVEMVGGSVVIADEQTFGFQAVNQKKPQRPQTSGFVASPNLKYPTLWMNWIHWICCILNSPTRDHCITFNRASLTRVEYPPTKGWVRSPS